jgi:hypothetical protein
MLRRPRFSRHGVANDPITAERITAKRQLIGLRREIAYNA